MKKLLYGTIFLVLVTAVSIPVMAAVDIHINIPLPPPIIFHGPPAVIVIPGTYVYVIPDIEVDIFFYRGWWWRLWEGRWYRSRYYDRGWVYYQYIPDFYFDIEFRWREFYRERHWHGHPWNYRLVPYHELQQNWRVWYSNRYWERERKWDVEKFQPTSPEQHQELRRQRQYEYARKPEVQKHEKWLREQQRKHQPQPPKQQFPLPKPQGKIEGERGPHRK